MPPTDVSFTSQHQQLRGDLYLPTNLDAPAPAVVMGPGFGGTKEMLFPPYCEALAAAGIAVLSFDYVNFGSSEGEPRQHMDLEAQRLNYGDALDHLRGRDDIDSERLGVFGSSLSGGHALATAAGDPRVRSVVVLIPFVGLEVTDELSGVVALGRQAAEDLAAGHPPQMITSHGRPGEVAAMSSDGAYEWMKEMTVGVPTFRNEVTLASLWNLANYRPATNLAAIEAPVHAVLATTDAITPAAAARNALAEVRSVDFVEIPQTHFELFTDHRQRTIDLTTDWFSADLLG